MRDEDHAGVERGERRLEPLQVGDVEVVGGLVEEQQVGVPGQRPSERGARELAAGEGRQRPVEVVVREAEPADDGGGARAPVPAAGMLETRHGLGVAPHRRLVVRAVLHRLFEPAQLLLERDQVGRAAEHVVPEGQVEVQRRPLVVEGDARALRERELAAVELGLPGEDAEQRRLAGAVRPGEGEALAALDLERDAVEEQGAGDLLAQVGGDHDGHGASVVPLGRTRREIVTTGAREIHDPVTDRVRIWPVPSPVRAAGLAPHP